MAREQAKEEARSAGIIGTLASMQGSFNSPTSPYGADFALGNDPSSALGAMTGTEIGQNFGFGGLGLRGTGRGGGGMGQGTIGMGNFGTIGRGGGRGVARAATAVASAVSEAARRAFRRFEAAARRCVARFRRKSSDAWFDATSTR